MHSLLLSLAAILIATKLLGELAQRVGQPSVLGELLAGIVLGGGALGVVDPRDPAVQALGALGLWVLIFQIGLHADVRSLRRLGSSTLKVTGASVALPLVLGFFAVRALGVSLPAAVIAAASLSVTSVAVSARLLGDKGVLRTREGQVVIPAALAGDVIGLVILSIVIAPAGGAPMSIAGITLVSAISIGFIIIALAVGGYAIPPLFRVLDRIRTKGSLGILGVAFGLLLAAISVASGTAMIIGAFVAGAILHSTPQRHEIERTTSQLGYFLVPVFFGVVGASVDLPALASGGAVEAGAALIAVGVAGKLAAGFAAFDFQGNRLLIGAAMVPRGEIGLIFAQMGLTAGAITPNLFGAMVVMVVVTTLVSPPLLEVVIRRDDSLDRDSADAPDTRKTGGRRQTAVGRRH